MEESRSIWTFGLWSVTAVVVFYFVWREIRQSMQASAQVKAMLSPEKPLRTIKRKSGLNSDIMREGAGPGAKNLDSLTVHYRTFLLTGEEVDSSYERGRTLTFELGKGAVIIGWDTALVGMKEGERRRVLVPSSQGYGSKGQNKVPPNTDVIFDIELLKLEPH